jgi:hypothetical protein
MSVAKGHYGFVIWTAYTITFIAIITTAGCSSKKEEKKTEEPPTAKKDINSPALEKKVQAEEKPALLPPEVNIATEINQADINQTEVNYIDTNESEVGQAEVNQIANEPCEVRISADVFLKELNKTSDSEGKIELLNSLFDRASEQDPCIIGIVRAASTDADANVALAAIELLQGYESPEIVPAIADAMAHPSEEVRQTAINLVSDVNDPRTGDLLVMALSDESEDVRNSAMDITKYKDKDIQYRVLEAAISCPHKDTKEGSLFMLQYVGGQRSVDILIKAMQDTDAEFSEEARTAVNTLFDEEFETYKQAKSWWEANRNRYDEDLSLIEEEETGDQ